MKGGVLNLKIPFFFFCLFFLVFLGAHPWHMEVPAAATPQLQQRQMHATSTTYTEAWGDAGSFNPLSRARDQTSLSMDTCQVLNPLSHNGNSSQNFLIDFYKLLFFTFLALIKMHLSQK